MTDEEIKQVRQRAANLIIIKHVARIMKVTNILYKELGITRQTVDNIISNVENSASRWDYKAVAEKMKLDPKVFTGDVLLKIEGENFKVLQQEYLKGVKNLINNTKDEKKRKEYKEILKKDKLSESGIWNYYFDSKSGGDSDLSISEIEMFIETEKMLKADLTKQVHEEDFNDAQLWKFWNYMRKKYNTKESFK